MKKINIDSPKKTIRDVEIGDRVTIFDFVNLYECRIGSDTRVGTFVEIQKGVEIGSHCKISSHTFICEGVKIGSGVFIGHNVSFINDRFPRATNSDGLPKNRDDWDLIPTTVADNASIGTGSTIMCGVVIGEGAMVGAGSVVTRDVPAHTTVAGCPAKVITDTEGN